MTNIHIGSLAIAKRNTGVCSEGERAVCYEIYEIGGRAGYSFIFEQGGYDGFSSDEAALMLDVTGTICPSAADYKFTNVISLSDDFRRGRFAEAFPIDCKAAI